MESLGLILQYSYQTTTFIIVMNRDRAMAVRIRLISRLRSPPTPLSRRVNVCYRIGFYEEHLRTARCNALVRIHIQYFYKFYPIFALIFLN